MDGLRPFKAGGQAKLVLHTTESDGKPNWHAKRSGIPHWTLDLDRAHAWQHLDTDVAAYTLANDTPGPSPNSDLGRVLQVEVIGYAKDAPTWSAERYGVLRAFILMVCKAEHIKHEWPLRFAGDEAYGLRGAVRLSRDEFKATAGIVGHQHAPSNSHWDPGAIKVDRLR